MKLFLLILTLITFASCSSHQEIEGIAISNFETLENGYSIHITNKSEHLVFIPSYSNTEAAYSIDFKLKGSWQKFSLVEGRNLIPTILNPGEEIQLFASLERNHIITEKWTENAPFRLIIYCVMEEKDIHFLSEAKIAVIEVDSQSIHKTTN